MAVLWSFVTKQLLLCFFATASVIWLPIIVFSYSNVALRENPRAVRGALETFEEYEESSKRQKCPTRKLLWRLAEDAVDRKQDVKPNDVLTDNKQQHSVESQAKVEVSGSVS